VSRCAILYNNSSPVESFQLCPQHIQILSRVEKNYEEAEKAFYRVMFWVTYPVGLLVILSGLAISVQPIGAGFMFGGICALSSGCYSAWDVMGRWEHFWSLVIALVLIVFAALWRFGKTPPPRDLPPPNAAI
jgi:hypothetical protein